MPADAARRVVAEFVGTFTLVFIGTSSIVIPAGGLVGVAFAHGLAIAVMVSALGHISGGHFNPAITLGFVLTRRIAAALAVLYWLAQLGAAVAAALLVKWVFPNDFVDHAKLGAPTLLANLGTSRGVVVELILTFFLVWVVFATAVDPRGTFKSIAGLAIGLTITLDILAGGTLTGAAMNPARAFGPQLVQRVWHDCWVWYVGPAVGGALAAVLYELLYLRPPRPVPVGPPATGVEEPRPGETAVS
jgi:aquaporin Z